MIGTGIGLLIAGLAGGGGAVYGAKKQSSAATKAAQVQTTSANTAAEIQAQSAKEALDYAKGVEATRRTEWQSTQNLNYDQYRQQQDRLDPYRQVGNQGLGILGATMQPGSGAGYQVRPTLNMIGQG